MKTLKDASYNDLEELRSLMGELSARIKEYSHVQEFIADSDFFGSQFNDLHISVLSH